MFRVSTFILILMCILTKYQVTPIASMIGDVQTVANFANDAMAFFKGELPLENLIMGSTGHAINQILDKMGEISQSLENMEANNERRMNHMISTLMRRLPSQSRVDTGLTELHSYVTRIDGMFEHFEYYVKKRKAFTNYTIADFIDATVSHDTGDILDVLDNMYRLMMPGRTGGFKTGLPQLIYINNEHLDFEERCGSGTSVQQRLYEIYTSVVISESRAFSMIIFSYALLMAYRKESFSTEMEKAAAQLVMRSQEYIIATERAMINSSRIVDRCDPPKYKRNQNFYELEGLMQMFVINEPDLTYNDCTGTCGDMFKPYTTGCYDYENWCTARSCLGYIYDCESASSSTICELPSDSRRRYDYAKNKWGTVYGSENSCTGSVRHPNGWLRGTVFCDVCFCTCAEQTGYSDAIRTINLRPKITDIQANMVLIGVKFISQDKQIMIQICEGQLLPGGRIKPETEHWIDLEHFSYISTEDYGGSFYLIKDNEKTKMYHNIDFAHIRYYQDKMNLDDVNAPFGYIVTGIKFENEGKDNEIWNETPLQISIHVTKFDFNNGTLYTDDESSHWVNAKNMDDPSLNYKYKRQEVVLSSPTDPSVGGRSVEISEPNQFIKFRASDRAKDAGQSTVPFFDGQSVIASPNTALSGIGLYHKGNKGSGGFLAFRLFTINLPGYLNTKLTDDMIEKYKPDYSGAIPYKI
ncbi:hypothetical protein PV327_010629 [Microctonus hyperodae]|uniref:Uncharacterized protein n=1 Tax=Microctonus hyperodae TaxID=165561 RepID=A0AA39FSC1_MICHY|nr:hypothetical protein PV327_010629 [Microctonus hyperodae]